MKAWTANSVVVRWVKAKALVLACILAVATPGCSNSEAFQTSLTSETFAQDYNPHYLEVLWVIDDRTPMNKYQSPLVAEAKNFFTRLESTLGTSSLYKMGITNMDFTYHPGQLLPLNSPALLGRHDGTLAQRLNLFGNVLSLVLNLGTDGNNKGLANSLKVLKGSQFLTDARVPLVLVYLSYEDDQSAPATTLDPVDYYAQELLALKNGNPDLLRVYAANYLPLPPGTPPSSTTRCARLTNNAIDTDPTHYQDRYFRLAQALSGDTADLCTAGFSNQFDLTGLQLKVLPKVFNLTGNPDVTTMQVRVTDSTGAVIDPGPFSYDPSTRQISFTNTPPEGSSILVTYRPGGI